MTNSIQRDNRRRLLLLQFQLKKLQCKTVSQDLNINKGAKKIFDREQYVFPRNSSITRVHNRCTLTGRSRGVLSFCKLSRIKARLLASRGELSGVSKASW